jgi:mannosyltransferase OCH1-like enzyme
MVVLRLGGAYADIDAECRQPLDSIIQPADTLLVGWDTEVSNANSAAAAGLARQRLIANWFFVAAAGHPVLRELCDHIARNAMSTFSRNSVRDTAERTGQAVWTDVVLRHALQHKAAKVGVDTNTRKQPTCSVSTQAAYPSSVARSGSQVRIMP